MGGIFSRGIWSRLKDIGLSLARAGDHRPQKKVTGVMGHGFYSQLLGGLTLAPCPSSKLRRGPLLAHQAGLLAWLISPTLQELCPQPGLL